jgi:hypothetical protein
MIDSIVIIKENGTRETRYRGHCRQCGVDKGYVRKDRIDNLCKSCATKLKMGRTPHNKGKTLTDEEKQKISIGCVGRAPWNKNKKLTGKPMSLSHKTKLSCSLRNMKEEEFDGFVAPVSQQERGKFEATGIRLECFRKSDYTCDKCNARGTVLNAHHLNSWKHFPEQRFDIDNLVTLCNVCHKQFHSIYGNSRITPNTKEQYLEFKKT